MDNPKWLLCRQAEKRAHFERPDSAVLPLACAWSVFSSPKGGIGFRRRQGTKHKHTYVVVVVYSSPRKTSGEAAVELTASGNMPGNTFPCEGNDGWCFVALQGVRAMRSGQRFAQTTSAWTTRKKVIDTCAATATGASRGDVHKSCTIFFPRIQRNVIGDRNVLYHVFNEKYETRVHRKRNSGLLLT